MTPVPEAVGPGRAATTAVVDALARWSQIGRVPTFTENKVETNSMFDGDAWARLSHLRDQADPNRLFVANHQV